MGIKNSLKVPSANQLQSIAELFLLARSGLDHWSSDDNFLVNMGSICPEDIDEEGSEGRNELLDILAEADLPTVSIDDLDVEPDDLQAILPAVTAVLEAYLVPGIETGTPKKFKEAIDSAFGQISLNSSSGEVNRRVQIHLKNLGLK